MAQHEAFIEEIKTFIPQQRLYTDMLRRLAWGTDASFYRLTPKVVVRAKDEAEVSRLMAAASRHDVPVTFRAAGTSLSGQSISDSVLIVAGKNWEEYELPFPDASTITLQPGLLGGCVNEILAPYGRYFTPDPASLKSAMIGGIVINNASGMSCGTHANSDRMLLSARIVLADGSVVDTGDQDSRARFEQSHKALLDEICAIRDYIRGNEALRNRLEHKYSIKNVTGLNMRPFIAYDDPFDILAHLMVGSEGTLGFISQVTMLTDRVRPFTATAMVYFQDIAEACRAVQAIKPLAVAACEMLDKKSLSSVHDTTGHDLTALLIETRADSQEQLDSQVKDISAKLEQFDTFTPVDFTQDKGRTAPWWQMRSGVFPIVAGTRPIGTTSLIEDVAFHIDDLPEATVELQQLLEDCGYDDACIYGHVLEGNYHFVIAQSFDTPQEIAKYDNLMHRIKQLVIDKYDGSLKAEHGTGRNMAAFVKAEWGDEAYGLMQRVKTALDPKGLLNPGVIFNDDPHCYLEHLKPLTLTNSRVDRCIECGFCEINCAACGLTLSARQRVAVSRIMSHLADTGEDPELLAQLRKAYKYQGNATCAGDGLCSTSCPMHINVGEMIHDLRQMAVPVGSTAHKAGNLAAKHLAGVCTTLRPVLTIANGASRILGDNATAKIGSVMHKVGLPLWTPSLPAGKTFHIPSPSPESTNLHTPSVKKVVYFPSCINRTFDASREDKQRLPHITDVIMELCHKAGYEVIFPKGLRNLCCGMIWESKGMPDIANAKTHELEKALLEASEGGRYPVMCDQSPCMHRMKEHIHTLKLYEHAEFIHDFLAPNLIFHRIDEPVAVHITCSARHMGIGGKIVALASMCASDVLVPIGVGCCAFAGDKGFTHPELNAYALRHLRRQIEKAGIQHGYSNSRTCEIGLTTNSGIPYKSIAYLVNQCTTAKPK